MAPPEPNAKAGDNENTTELDSITNVVTFTVLPTSIVNHELDDTVSPLS